MSDKRTRKISYPVVDEAHQKTGPITKRGPQKRRGNPTKSGGIFGSRFSRGSRPRTKS